MSTHSDFYARLAAERNTGRGNPPNPVILAHFRRRLAAGEEPASIGRDYGVRHPREVAKYAHAARAGSGAGGGA